MMDVKYIYIYMYVNVMPLMDMIICELIIPNYSLWSLDPLHIHTYVHTYICTYIHTCVHTYICTYIHMYIFTYIASR